MKNGFRVLEKPLISPTAPSTRLARLSAVEGMPARRPFKILAPIDFTGGFERAAEHAIDVARAMGADLSLLNVGDPGSHPARTGLRALDLTLPENIRRVVVNGPVAEAITICADFFEADVVLMIGGDYRRWKPPWKGSVTSDVLKSSNRPVLIADAHDGNARFRCRRILCALALDGTDGPTLRRAEALALRTGGDLMLVSVLPEVSEGWLHEVLSGGRRPFSASLAMDRLHKIGASLAVPYKTSIMVGSPHRCIGSTARQYAADIVVASRPGSDTRTLFRRLTCPLLSVAVATPPLVSVIGGVHSGPHQETSEGISGNWWN